MDHIRTAWFTMDIFDNRLAKPMLIASKSAPFDSDDYTFELNLGGERCIAYLDRVTELVNARNIRIISHFPELASLHEQVGRRCILDGKVTVADAAHQDGHFLSKRLRVRKPIVREQLSKHYPCVFVAFDLLYLDTSPVTRMPLVERQTLLRALVPDSERMFAVRSVEGRGLDFNRLVQTQGLRGVIAKRKNSPYRMGKRTRDWVQFARWHEADFVICGFIPDEDSTHLVLGQYNDSGNLVYKGLVPLGRDRLETEIILNQAPLFRHPFSGHPREPGSGAVWVQPRLVCSVGYTSLSMDKQPLHPVFMKLIRKIPYAAAEPA